MNKVINYKETNNPLRNILVVVVIGIILSETFFGYFVNSGTLARYVALLRIAMAYMMIMCFIPKEIRLLNHQLIRYVLVVLFLFNIYIFLHSVDLTMASFQIMSSSLLFVLLSSALAHKKRIYLFSLMIFAITITIVLHPGLGKILDLNRSFGSIFRGDADVLKGFSGHYIDYSMRSMIAFFLGVGLFIISKNLFIKAFVGFLSVTALIGSLTAGSRGAIIAVFCGCVFFVFALTRTKFKNSHIKKKHILLCCAIALFFLPWGSFYEVFTMEYSTTGSLGERWELYIHGLKLFSNNFLFGIGWNGFRSLTGTSQHSNWLCTFVELGTLGGLGEVILWFLFFKLSFTAKKISEHLMYKDMSVLIISWSSIMASFFVWQGYENIGLLTGTRLHYICFGIVSAIYLFTKRSLYQYNLSHINHVDPQSDHKEIFEYPHLCM